MTFGPDLLYGRKTIIVVSEKKLHSRPAHPIARYPNRKTITTIMTITRASVPMTSEALTVRLFDGLAVSTCSSSDTSRLSGRYLQTSCKSVSEPNRYRSVDIFYASDPFACGGRPASAFHIRTVAAAGFAAGAAVPKACGGHGPKAGDGVFIEVLVGCHRRLVSSDDQLIVGICGIETRAGGEAEL